MNLIQEDTGPDARRKQFEILRNMSGRQRLQIAFELSDKTRQELIADIKNQHPEFTERQVKLETIRRCYGEEPAQKVAAAKGRK